MATMGIAILAAGKGTRLKVDRSKALCPALGLALIDHVILAAQAFTREKNIVAQITAVVGHKREEVIAHVEGKFPGQLSFAWQREQRGTADALRSYFSECPQNAATTYTFVVCADTPLVTAATFGKLWEAHQSQPGLEALAASFEAQQPKGYGRILREGVGFRIVEEKDATPEERQVREVNSGFYLVKTQYLLKQLATVDNKNQSGEFYLTDIFSPRGPVQAVLYPDEREFLGVNTLEQLEQVTQILRQRKLSLLMLNGVMCHDASNVWVDAEAEVASGAIIYPGVQIYGKSRVATDVILESGVILKECVIEQGAQVLAYSHLEKTLVEAQAQVGPFARLRPETVIGQEAKVGNFVEIKKSRLHEGAKVSHLSYVGDAEVGANSNLGCGFITCNYDGKDKHRTKIGAGVFIGSDVQVIAPIEIGDRSFIAAGSTITKDLPAGGFAIARSQQTTKEGLAHRFLKLKK